MHSYQHHIKDFNNATRHLTRVERALYRDAIELYYETEQPLPADDFDRLARRLLAFSEEEKAALSFILREFFEQTGDVYSHDRCDEEIDRYKSMQTSKARAGKASAIARRKKATARKKARRTQAKQKATGDEQVLDSVGTEGQQNPTNHEPGTMNHEPSTSPPSGGPSGELPLDHELAKSDSPEPGKRSKPKRPIPDDFEVTPHMVRWAEENNLGHIPLAEQTERFIDHWKSKGEARADWVASWRTWIRNADKFARERASAGATGSRAAIAAEIHGPG